MAENPIALVNVETVKEPVNVLEQLARNVIDEGRAALRDRETWEQKIVKFHKKRYGIRARKTFPWPGASNLNMPMVDKSIRRFKPNFVNLVLASRPIVAFDPVGGEDIQGARKAEQFFDWLLRTHIPNFFRSLTRGTDWMLERGFYLWKIIWEFQTRSVKDKFRMEDIPESDLQRILQAEQDPQIDIQEFKRGYFSGRFGLDMEDDTDLLNQIVDAFDREEEEFEFEHEEPFINRPKLVAIKPQDVIVPNDTTDIDNARLICHRMFLTANDLKIKERDGIYKDVDKVNFSTKRMDIDNLLLTTQADREGVTDFPRDEGLAEIWECYFWWDIDDDGVKEKVVMTIDEDTGTVLRFIELPYDHGQWPFVQIRFEENDDRYYSSRGIPEILDDVSTEINAQHNMKIDRMTIANAPMILKRPHIEGVNIRFIPGQTINTLRNDDLTAFQIPILDASFEREEQILKAWGEEHLGDPSFALAGPLSGLTEARTATEITTIQQSSGRIFSLDGRIYQDGMRRVYQQIWDLWNQFGPDEVWIRTMNSPPTKLTRNEIQGKYDLRPTGTPETSNPLLEAQKANARLQLLKDDPFVRQQELVRDFLEKDDLRVSQRLLKSDQELQQEAQQRAQEEDRPVTIDEATKALKAQQKQGRTQVQI